MLCIIKFQCVMMGGSYREKETTTSIKIYKISIQISITVSKRIYFNVAHKAQLCNINNVIITLFPPVPNSNYVTVISV